MKLPNTVAKIFTDAVILKAVLCYGIWRCIVSYKFADDPPKRRQVSTSLQRFMQEKKEFFVITAV
jgi:hypothetical protein